MYIDLHVKRPVFVSDLNETCIFWTDFRKNTQVSSFTNIYLVGAEFFHVKKHTCIHIQTNKQTNIHTYIHTERQTDRQTDSYDEDKVD